MSETIKYRAYALPSASLDTVVEAEFERELDDKSIVVKIVACGICGTDVMEGENHFSVSEYHHGAGLVCGHEAIGIVVKKGANATKFNLGDRVGWGYQRDCCGVCVDCVEGWESCCRPGYKPLFNHGETGGFAEYIVAVESLAFKIPDAMDSHDAPLLCGGATMWTPLNTNNLVKGSKVGIIAVGGLGHMGVQFSHKMGYETSVFTRSLDKSDLAKSLGAVNVIDSQDKLAVQKYLNYFDLIINTVPAPIDADFYCKLLKRNGKLVYVGLSTEPVTVDPFTLMQTNCNIGGSVTAGSEQMELMLAFAAEQGVKPLVEVVSVPFGENNAQKVSEALKYVKDGKPRFRMVLDYGVDVEELKKNLN